MDQKERNITFQFQLSMQTLDFLIVASFDRKIVLVDFVTLEIVPFAWWLNLCICHLAEIKDRKQN